MSTESESINKPEPFKKREEETIMEFQLGDVIRINNPVNQILNNQVFFIDYIDTKKIYSMGPYGANHATNGTMAYRKRFANTHFYDNYITMGEEKTFLENYSHPIIQLDPTSTILVICHSDNTVDKHEIRNSLTVPGRKSYQIKELSYQLHDIIANPYLQEFYRTLHID